MGHKEQRAIEVGMGGSGAMVRERVRERVEGCTDDMILNYEL